MNTTTPQSLSEDSEFMDMLPDFLNGHLDQAQRLKLVAALESSPALREQLEFQSALQNALREEVRTREQQLAQFHGPDTGFEAIAGRIVDSPLTRLHNSLQDFWSGGSLLSAGVTAFSMLLAVGVLAFSNLLATDPVNEFNTAVAPEQHSQPTLRILPRTSIESESFKQLLKDHRLRVKSLHTESNMADVVLINLAADFSSIAVAVGEDERVILTKVLKSETARQP